MKRKKWKQVVAVWSLLIGIGTGATGCQIGSKEVVVTSSLSEKDVFCINNKVCSLEEAKVFLTNYQNLYGTAYGVDLWQHDFGEISLEQYIKDLTISQLAQIVSMNFLAEQQQITLSEEEVSQVEKAADEYYKSLTKKEIQYMGVEKKDIRELYLQYGLANKLYTHLTTGINDEVSDDEARVMEAYQIYVTDKDKAEKISKELKKGTDFLTLAGSYNEASQAQLAFGRGELPSEVEAVAFTLEPDQISNSIKTENGYYFIKCINNYNQELTDANKLVTLERRRKAAFDDVYDEFIETLPTEFNEELWSTVEVELDAEIKTKSFFETYETYCKW